MGLTRLLISSHDHKELGTGSVKKIIKILLRDLISSVHSLGHRWYTAGLLNIFLSEAPPPQYDIKTPGPSTGGGGAQGFSGTPGLLPPSGMPGL